MCGSDICIGLTRKEGTINMHCLEVFVGSVVLVSIYLLIMLMGF